MPGKKPKSWSPQERAKAIREGREAPFDAPVLSDRPILPPASKEKPVAPAPDHSFMRAVGVALNPTIGSSMADRLVPLLVTVAIVILALGCAFGFVPGADFQDSVLLLTGAGAGAFVRHAGRR